ncbi:MAG TPA: dihydrofolate reductase [Dermatophilaceae bacterium]|jgi:dihydrofolate reductase|nr:dihydrofolate reductase [Dermatophilaceae bacterium]
MTITVLAAVGANLVIGRDGNMPWHLPEDLAHFKATTMGHTMVMGRKTYDTIGRALPGRRTIVITRQLGWHAPSVEVAHSLPEALALAGPADVFVVGGSDVYRQAMPFADQMLLTEIDQSPEGDAFFPAFSTEDWLETSRETHDGFAFVTYERTLRSRRARTGRS